MRPTPRGSSRPFSPSARRGRCRSPPSSSPAATPLPPPAAGTSSRGTAARCPTRTGSPPLMPPLACASPPTSSPASWSTTPSTPPALRRPSSSAPRARPPRRRRVRLPPRARCFGPPRRRQRRTRPSGPCFGTRTARTSTLRTRPPPRGGKTAWPRRCCGAASSAPGMTTTSMRSRTSTPSATGLGGACRSGWCGPCTRCSCARRLGGRSARTRRASGRGSSRGAGCRACSATCRPGAATTTPSGRLCGTTCGWGSASASPVASTPGTTSAASPARRRRPRCSSGGCRAASSTLASRSTRGTRAGLRRRLGSTLAWRRWCSTPSASATR
mmetsp:Transcript_15601/g.46426  ORF Transcript_15601/g.46426 Transcript_15601/m.46426 type:complete len:329 (-) Transcript_15601:932-1918(-)